MQKDKIVEAVIDEASFLLDRLDECERDFADDDATNYYHGHVDPPKARLRRLLAALAAQPRDDVVELLREARDGLKAARVHIEHMAAWIAAKNTGYSFEALGEDSWQWSEFVTDRIDAALTALRTDRKAVLEEAITLAEARGYLTVQDLSTLAKDTDQ